MSINYLLDENLPPLYKVQLLRRQSELIVWMIGEPGVPPTGTLDPEILLWCESNNFIFNVTRRPALYSAKHSQRQDELPQILTF